MAELQTTIAATSERADTVNSKLGAHREQIEQLNGVRNLIKKLQAVFDLPQRLRVCIDQNAIALAVKYYAAGTGGCVITHSSSHPSIHSPSHPVNHSPFMSLNLKSTCSSVIAAEANRVDTIRTHLDNPRLS